MNQDEFKFDLSLNSIFGVKRYDERFAFNETPIESDAEGSLEASGLGAGPAGSSKDLAACTLMTMYVRTACNVLSVCFKKSLSKPIRKGKSKDGLHAYGPTGYSSSSPPEAEGGTL